MGVTKSYLSTTIYGIFFRIFYKFKKEKKKADVAVDTDQFRAVRTPTCCLGTM
jgi:hypothetical protein